MRDSISGGCGLCACARVRGRARHARSRRARPSSGASRPGPGRGTSRVPLRPAAGALPVGPGLLPCGLPRLLALRFGLLLRRERLRLRNRAPTPQAASARPSPPRARRRLPVLGSSARRGLLLGVGRVPQPGGVRQVRALGRGRPATSPPAPGTPQADGCQQQQTNQAAEPEAGDSQTGHQLAHVAIEPVATERADGGAAHREQSDEPPPAAAARVPLLLVSAAHAGPA